MLPVPSHSTVLLLAAVSILGAVVSSIVNVASRLIELLLESVSVKVTVSFPVPPQASLKPKLLFEMITSPQLSVPEKVLFNQLLNSVVFPAPSHSTVKSLGGNIQVGSSASTLMVIYSLQVTPLVVTSTQYSVVSVGVTVIFSVVSPVDHKIFRGAD